MSSLILPRSNITNGLGQNKAVPVELLLTIAHGFSVDGFEGILKRRKKGGAEKEVEERKSRRPESCFLLPEDPGRSGFKPKTTAATNKNVMIDFGKTVLGLRGGVIQVALMKNYDQNLQKSSN